MTDLDAFDERVKRLALHFYREKGIKSECERCWIVTDPKCPDFPHICALEEGLKEPGKNKDWILENLSDCIEMRMKLYAVKPTFFQRVKIKILGVAFSHKEVLREGAEPTSLYFAHCSIHGYYTDYPHGYGEKLKCPVCYPREDKVPREFPKNNNRTYRILDEGAYERFWVGRKPSSKLLFEEWLFNPKATMNAVSQDHGKVDSTLLQRLNRELVNQGVMERVKTHE